MTQPANGTGASHRCMRCGAEDFLSVDRVEYDDDARVGGGIKPLQVLPAKGGGRFRLWICAACGFVEWYASVTMEQLRWAFATRNGGVTYHLPQRSKLRTR